MTKYSTNNFPILNLYKKPSVKSEIVTQMIFGDSFSIFEKKRNWLKIKIKEEKGTPGDFLGCYANISKIKKDLKFKPKHNLLVGLKKFNEFLDDGSKK